MAAQKKIYIHIGPPKSGTTTIQAGLRLNREALEQNGYYVPLTGSVQGELLDHRFVAMSLAEDNKRAQARVKPHHNLENLIKEIESQNPKNVILSSEAFFILPQSQIKVLQEKLLEGYQPIIIIYVRRQDVYLQSTWVETVKSVWTLETFEDFVDHFIVKRPQGVDYDLILRWWENEFGLENIRVRVFDEVIQSDKNLFHDFMETCDHDQATSLVVPENKNPSPSLKSIELLRETLRRMNLNMHDSSYMREMYVMTNPVSEYCMEQGWNNEKLNLITRELYDKISNHFADSNRSVAQRYFGKDTLFPEGFRDKPVSQFDLENDVSRDEIHDMLAHFIKIYYEERLKARDLASELKGLKRQQGAKASLTTGNAIITPEVYADFVRDVDNQLAEMHSKLEVSRQETSRMQGKLMKTKKNNQHLRRKVEKLQENASSSTVGSRQVEVLQAQVEVLQSQLAVRNSLPLSRVSELLGAVQREFAEGGFDGLVKRSVAWVQGERQHKQQSEN